MPTHAEKGILEGIFGESTVLVTNNTPSVHGMGGPLGIFGLCGGLSASGFVDINMSGVRNRIDCFVTPSCLRFIGSVCHCFRPPEDARWERR